MLAVCISSLQRHTGNSLKPGTRKRSNADMIPHPEGNPPASALRSFAVAVCSKLLTWIAKDETPPQQNGCNYIADCAFDEITDPVALEARLAAIVDVAENGPFVSLASWSADRTALGAIER